jgi:LmbE family N-acetylglucosaminyl deacetylase
LAGQDEAVPTAVFLHAHPDDECVLTAGTMVQLAAAGNRIVLVVATRGEHGEVDDGVVLADGETLGQHRTVELEAAASVLGVSRVEWLGYVDSGMDDTPTNDLAGAFWLADIDEAAGRLAAILRDEQAATLVVYDDHGGYGHPDHVQVHRVGVRAAELAGTPVVYEATIDRDRLVAQMHAAKDEGLEGLPEELPSDDFGVTADLVTTRVDVTSVVKTKRQAMACHRSQISETSFWLAMDDEPFAAVFGTEEYIRRGAPAGMIETALDLSSTIGSLD